MYIIAGSTGTLGTAIVNAMAKDNYSEIEEEIGDLIFSIINLSRKLKIDPENALRITNNKFFDRIDSKFINVSLFFIAF